MAPGRPCGIAVPRIGQSGCLRAAVARAFALELVVSLLFGLGFLQGYDLRLGQDQALVGNLGFQRAAS